MNIANRLDSIREAFPECETVAYADISTNMVLSSSAATQLRQEHLNDLSNTAVDLLCGGSAQLLSRIWDDGTTESGGVFQAIIIDPTELGIFLRSMTSPADALCCVCTLTVNVSAFIADARYHLEEIGLDR